jgi:hypothetical protein
MCKSLSMQPKHPFAKGVLQQNQIRFLITINSEAKVRRATKSEILAKGEGKVMSYKDLEAARVVRAVCAAKEQAKVKGRGKHRKGKGSGEAGEPESSKVTPGQKRNHPGEVDAPEPKPKVAQMTEAQVEEDKIAPNP